MQVPDKKTYNAMCCSTLGLSGLTLLCCPGGDGITGGKIGLFALIAFAVIPYYMGTYKMPKVEKNFQIGFSDFNILAVNDYGKHRLSSAQFASNQRQAVRTKEFALTFDGNRMYHTPTNYRYAHAGFEATWANPQTKNHFVNRFLHYYLNVVNKFGDTKYLFEAKTNRNGRQLYYLRKVTGVRTGLKAKGYTVNAEGYMSRLNERNTFLGIFTIAGNQTFCGTYESIIALINAQGLKYSEQVRKNKRSRRKFIGPVYQYCMLASKKLACFTESHFGLKAKKNISVIAWIPPEHSRDAPDVWLDGFGGYLDEVDSKDTNINTSDDGKTDDDGKKLNDTGNDQTDDQTTRYEETTFGMWFRALELWMQIGLIGLICLVLILILCCSYFACCAPDDKPQYPPQYPMHPHARV